MNGHLHCDAFFPNLGFVERPTREKSCRPALVELRDLTAALSSCRRFPSHRRQLIIVVFLEVLILLHDTTTFLPHLRSNKQRLTTLIEEVASSRTFPVHKTRKVGHQRTSRFRVLLLLSAIKKDARRFRPWMSANRIPVPPPPPLTPIFPICVSEPSPRGANPRCTWSSYPRHPFPRPASLPLPLPHHPKVSVVYVATTVSPQTLRDD